MAGCSIEASAYSENRLYQYGDSGQLLSEHFINGKGRHYKIRNYIWLSSQPIAMVEQLVNTSHAVYAEAIYYLHTDHLNTPQRITNAQQQVIWQWQGDAFGDGKEIADPDGDGKKFWFPLRFPGQYYDGETGLNYNYYRDYDPRTGRYIQSDPIGIEGGLNTYGYAYQNPVRYTDPTGLAVPAVIAGCASNPACAAAAARTGKLIVDLVGGGIATSSIFDDDGPDPLDIPNDESKPEQCPAPDKKDCEALRQSILNTCFGLTGRKRMACFEG